MTPAPPLLAIADLGRGRLLVAGLGVGDLIGPRADGGAGGGDGRLVVVVSVLFFCAVTRAGRPAPSALEPSARAERAGRAEQAVPVPAISDEESA